ncbi:MAG TPA: glycosyltransferase family 4 protein [Hyphomicrobiaceae bacterium]|nr:glycosyltransferase family 4 protein [Hyphomicrobiaceae bacterium]
MIWQFIDSSGVGGAERHIATIASSLLRAGLDVRVVLYQRHGTNPWLEQLDTEGLPTTILGGSFRSLLGSLRAQRPALLHTHGYKAGILGRIAARAAGVPVVSTYHSGERGPWPVGLYDFLDDWTGVLARRIAVSPAIQARLPLTSTLIPSYVIGPPAPPSAALPRRIGFIGRLSEEKGPDRFCELAQRYPEIGEWHVYGDGPMRGHLETAYGHLVRFHGVVTDLSPVWPTLGLVVMPSRFEGIPLVALEAGTHGVPVLAANVGGLGTIVDHGRTGWLYQSGSIEEAGAYLAAWSEMVGDGGTSELRRACWQVIRDRYSEERWLPEILNVYRAAGWTDPSERASAAHHNLFSQQQ